MLDQAFETLKTLDWGTDLKPLDPIDAAIISSRDDAAARQDLETRLVAVLKSAAPRDAKDYACRKLMIVGSAASVPALAELLLQDEYSHMARFALERIEAKEAGDALRDGLGKVKGKAKAGVIGSLGARRDKDSVKMLGELLNDSDADVARAAATALGNIATDEAAKALADAKPADGKSIAAVKLAMTDAKLACAEALLADGKKAEALAIYKSFAGADQPKHVRLAGTRGMLAVAGK